MPTKNTAHEIEGREVLSRSSKMCKHPIRRFTNVWEAAYELIQIAQSLPPAQQPVLANCDGVDPFAGPVWPTCKPELLVERYVSTFGDCFDKGYLFARTQQ